MIDLNNSYEIELNTINEMDCIDGLKMIYDNTIDMVYLDPPFYTQTIQRLKDKSGNEYSFDDKWESMDEYMNYLELRLKEIRRVMKSNANVFVHCDRTASHYIRLLLDKIFGADNFRNEIIWSYKRWSNSKKGLLEAHQNIYNYSKTNIFKFNKIYTDYSVTTNVDQILQDRMRNNLGKTVYKTDDNGQIMFENEKKGVPLSDVWEIPFLNPKAKERTGYPTQKPLELLERIVEISTDEGDVILDPFCGSGTSLVAAKRLYRNYIGFDINPSAIEISRNRIKNPIKTSSTLLKKGKDFYDKKNDKEKQILSNFDCHIVQRNSGLDAILCKKINGSGVGIRIQKKNEPLNVALKYLKIAMKKRNFDKSILIRTNHEDTVEHDDSIILIDTFDSQLKRKN
ncbi:site-specific DNA-methyltransferase [uncultured Fenollaria sp.]|uniref:DNA-methyltransferase n=1 Tax=uncultured Fenollaria sp. TaxID=1686315 RepID=UPI0025CFBD9E|nr:site-specific DNA-methyltransferase [uncultured Fenollaria sp.]